MIFGRSYYCIFTQKEIILKLLDKRPFENVYLHPFNND
ncbi:Hypothetical protein Ccan_01310 [Capnocytophaga canimorsus Cc5]|uniref:Uncharacterized protein n=1 Tax=Capnocytophaga canimorsus (strain 5) TaxID=860228 RepID=F9YQ85_CAPCC|nr:Hypothetical protein Ccan_01310 [Capnocytophaga canimorsus Cc5]